MVQISLMSLIVVGYNLQGRYSEIRAEADCDVSAKAERKIEVILAYLEKQSELLEKIQKK